MPFVNVWRCVHCKDKLTYRQVMYSHGRCPLCGYKEVGAGTIVETFELSRFVPSLAERVARAFYTLKRRLQGKPDHGFGSVPRGVANDAIRRGFDSGPPGEK